MDGDYPLIACCSIVYDQSECAPGNLFRTVRIIALSLLIERAPGQKSGEMNERAGSPAIFEIMNIHFLDFVL